MKFSIPQPHLPHSQSAPRPSEKAGVTTTGGIVSEPHVLPFTVLVDDRERAGGWSFAGMTGDAKRKYAPLVVPQQIKRMITADYSIVGMEDSILIERKSVTDLLGSIIGGHARLKDEHERMQAIVKSGGKACLICEGSYDQACDELELRNKSARILEGIAASWPLRYGVPWYFAGSRVRAESLCLSILWKHWEYVSII